MAKINTLNYQTVASWNGSQDLFVVEQPDGTKVATPAQIKQYVLGNSIDDIYSVMGQNGAKNLIPYPYYEKSHVESGITWTDNGDGTVTANGTATATSYFGLTSRTLVTNMADSLIEGERYILTGCPTGGSNQKYDIFINETYNGAEVGLAFDYGNGATFTLDHKTENNYGVGIRIRSGQTVSNLTFKPMLRIASDTDNTYQPYAKTNRQLTEVIGDLSQTGLTGDSVAEQLDTAREQIAAITNLIDVQEVTVAYPSSGTPIQKVQAIATAVYSALTIKRPFTIVNIKGDGVYRSEMLISAVTASFSYSQAIFMGYYTNKIYRIENSNGTVTVKQLAEV